MNKATIKDHRVSTKKLSKICIKTILVEMQVFIFQMRKKIIAAKDSTKHSSSQAKKTKIIKIKIKAS
jgi:hypothetical protein